jgi:hypothetical protein
VHDEIAGSELPLDEAELEQFRRSLVPRPEHPHAAAGRSRRSRGVP